MGRDVSALDSNAEPITANASDTEAATSHVSPELSEVKAAADEEDRATTEHDTTKNSSSVTGESPDKPQDVVQGSSTPKAAESDVQTETSKPDAAAAARKPIKKLSSTVLTKFQPEEPSDTRSPMFDETKQKASVEVRETIFGARKVFNRKPPPPAASSPATPAADQVKDVAPDITQKPTETKVTAPATKEDDGTKDTHESRDNMKVNSADKVGDDDQMKGNDLGTDKKLNLGENDTIKEPVPDDHTHEPSNEKLNVAADQGNDDTVKETVSDTDQKPIDKKLNIAVNEKDQVKEIVPETHNNKLSDKKLNSAAAAKGSDQDKEIVPEIDKKLSDKKLNLAAAKGSDQVKEVVPETHKNLSGDKKLNSAAAKGNDQVKEVVPETHHNKPSDKKLNLALAKGSDQVKETPKLNDKKVNLAAKGNDQTKETGTETRMLSEKKVNSPAQRNDQMKDAAFEDHKKVVKGNDTMKDIRAPETHSDGAEESVDSGGSSPRENSFFHYPSKSKKSQEIHQQVSRKFHPEFRRHDDDNCSVASSTASSARTNKFKPTVGVAPTFRCVERLQKRKEYYSKLENKHQALEAERMEYEARRKEEEKEYVKQLRKTMVFKANPVPSFYKEGPPPKTELKKLPVTRPKSPKLTRRKSCGDVASPAAAGDKGVTPRRTSTSNAQSPKKVKQNAKTTSSKHHKVAEQQTADISVNG